MSSVQDRRRELLRKRIAESGLAAAESTPQPRLSAGQSYPLSAGQRRMWFLQTMDPDDPTLNICVGYELHGALDADRLNRAFNDVVARHIILRTTYGSDEQGEPFQVFVDDVEIPFQRTDLTEIPAADRDAQIDTLIDREFGRSFDLAKEPPLRVTLVRANADRYVLLLVIHHIAWDDDCLGVFFGELNAAYNGEQQGPQAPQYLALNVFDASAEHDDADVDYWRTTLRPLPEPLELPGMAAGNRSRRAGHRAAPLPADLVGRVETFAGEHSATPFMVLLATFGVLIRRYTGIPDFLVSIPVTDRPAAATNAIGYFGNTLLLRMDARSSDTFGTYVEAVRDTCVAGFAHQSVGVDRVVREANPERSYGADGMDQLVRLGFSMRKTAGGIALDGVRARQLDVGAVTAERPIALAIVTDPQGISLEVEYQRDVVTDAVAAQLLSHYTTLLDNALSDPGRRLTGLDLLDADERAAVLAQSHGELVATPAATMVGLIESVVAARPDAIAVVSDDIRLTYAQLHGRANRLARWLIAQGIGTEDVIGLQMTTSVEFIVAMIAVLKSGAAYLPIDPAYPQDRIDYLVADTKPRIVIGPAELEAAEWAAAQLSDTTLTDGDRLRPLRPEHLAYVIYTSGSTGKPKGVAVSHHAIAEHVDGFVAEWSMTADDRLLQSSSVSFDASLLDIFVTLCLGAQLVVPKPEAFGDIPYMADLINRHRITVLHMVPSMLSTLLLLPQVGEWRALRHVPVGGEALPGEIADKFAGYFDAELRNHYGPTEAVVCSTHMDVKGRQGSGVVPIGVPNRNVYTYVLDEEMAPVPADVVGELYLGGVQLARGYLGRPGLTAQRFVADPFNPGMRLYRSGDLVRRNVSGHLEFVGRADEQVKIRGYRIELGEVESALATHKAVGHCVVVVEDSDAGPALAAYVVPSVTGAPSRQPDLEEIRAHGAAVLPDYMVPTAFAVISEIPLTVSGKLDKRALPTATRVTGRTHRAPGTDTERRVCAIFEGLFGCDRVSADDSFFALGGHSLLVARLVAQVRADFGVDLSVRAVFDSPTPCGLATGLDALVATPPSGRRPEPAKRVRPEWLPLSYSQLAMWFQHRMEGPSDAFNMALALEFDGPLNAVALTEALNDVVFRHEALRTNFVERDGLPYQVVRPHTSVDLPVADTTADRLTEALAELRRFILDPESDRLIRPTLLRLDGDTHVLNLVIHHIIADHVSMGVLFSDLISAYRARVEQTPQQWPEHSIQYADYVLWQRDTFDSDGEWATAQLAHWQDALAGLPDEISVAPDRSRPFMLGRRGEAVKFTVPAERRAELTRLAEQERATEFILYEAVLAAVMHKLGGGVDIAVGTPAASRVDEASANLIGLFANMVVLRNDLSGDPTLRGIVGRTRDTVLDAFAHQELPIERLVEALNPPRSRSRNPLFQTMINFIGQEWATAPRAVSQGTTVVGLSMDLDVPYLDLNVGLSVNPDGGLDVWVVANADLYEPDTVAQIADAMSNALHAFASTPDKAVSEVELLPAATMRRLLAAPTAIVVEPAAPGARGSAETERALIGMLEELLDISGIEPDDNFFALGGDSIISVQWSARASATGLVFTPAMVFEHMTIGGLACAVDAQASAPAAEVDSTPQHTPMSASGLSPDALADLTASWQQQS